MKNLLIVLVVLLFSGCTKESFDSPILASKGDIFYFSGNYDPLQTFPLLYYFDEDFQSSNNNYLETSSFDLLTKTDLEVGVINYYNEINYIIAKKIAINYNDYGKWSESSDQIYNGLWTNTQGGYPQDFLLAINSESQEVVVEFLRTGKTLRRSYHLEYYETGDVVILIDTMTLSQGVENWEISKNFLTEDLATGIATLSITDEANNCFTYLNSLLIIDGKK